MDLKLGHIIEGLQEKTFLLTVSGGVDSMALLHLFRNENLNFEVAHCNFQLRGEASDSDEALVRDYCKKHKITFHVKKFAVKAYKKSGNYSTQMAARNLRYAWFEELIKERNIDFIVTAHHFDDQIETFIINLSRGTGIKGLSGLKELDNNRLKPLLKYSKSEILDYAKKKKIDWREDESNQSDDYIRNKIRHHITPVLRELHPDFDLNFKNTLNYIGQESIINEKYFNQLKKNLFQSEKKYIMVKIDELINLDPVETHLHHLFSGYGFTSVNEILKLVHSENGKYIEAKEFSLIKDRNKLILKPKTIVQSFQLIVEEDEIELNGLHLKFNKSDSILSDSTVSIDNDSVAYPLKVRSIKPEDFFYPVGLGGKKKVKKFLKDEKLTLIEKENTLVLCDAEDRIIWVIGRRLDERFKIKENTKNYLNITIC